MKTTNNAQKTENGQVKTMVLRGVAVIFSLVLISWTVSAQDFWKELLTNNTYGKMAILMIEQTNETKNADAAIDAIHAELAIQANHSTEALVLVNETESNLEIEAWMTDETYFASRTSANAIEAEDALEIEGWMTNDAYFSNSTASSVDTEPALDIENWMVQDTFFNSDKVLADREFEMEIEAWMMNDTYFESLKSPEESLELEVWMTDTNIWGF